MESPNRVGAPAPNAFRIAPRLAVLRLAALVGCVLCGSTACSDGGREAAPRPAHHVVFVLLDTLRADRLGSYGAAGGLTPAIDSFARDAVLFERAFAHAPWTLPSVASIFTSQHPGRHGAGGRLGEFRVLPEGASTLAERFRDGGAATAAIINVLFLTEEFGMTQGFDHVDAVASERNALERRADTTTDAALAWLAEVGDRPFFLFVHYFDAHLTYDPPPPFRARHAAPRDADADSHLFGTVNEMLAFRRGEIQVDRETIGRLERLYDGEVAFLDREVGRLLDGLDELGLAERSVVVLTSDHGEEFAEHGGFEHGHTLYDELLHVPLLIRLPGVDRARADAPAGARGRRVAASVRLIDLGPTLLELAGLAPAPDFRGESLVPLLRDPGAGKTAADRPVLSQGNMWGPSLSALRRSGFKWIERSPDEPAELFAVATDPGETRNLAESHHEQAKAMAEELRLVLEDQKGAGSGATPDLSPEQLERLRALGYAK